MYSLKQKEAYWLELMPGVQLYVKPLTSALMLRVQADLPPSNGDEDNHDWYVEFVKHIALAAIEKWSGIGDADGNLADVTRDNVWCLLDDYQLFTEFQTQYLADYQARQSEKNA